MPKDKSSQTPPERGQYGDVVQRLEHIVEALEAGQLSLEDSIERFHEGITLVKQGEAILADAERRIEQLLSEDGRTIPLKAAPDEPPRTPSATKPAPPAKPQPARPPQEDPDDVPF